MIPQDVPHNWSSQALLNKAEIYKEEMLSHAHDDWTFALWSTLSLELLARAALSNVDPILLGDAKSNWRNLLYSLGIQTTDSTFTPRAINISEVFNRLRELIPDFTPELEKFCIGHMSRRNEELHSGSSPFSDANVSSWLPKFYQACKVLLESMDDTLSRFLDEDEAVTAIAMIRASKDESAKSIKQSVKSYKQVWNDKSDEEKERLQIESKAWANRHEGHVVDCPACKCNAMLTGEAIKPAAIEQVTENEFRQRQEYLPSRCECIACGFKITGLSHLNVVGLGDPYNATTYHDRNEFYAMIATDYYSDWEPDFNEP